MIELSINHDVSKQIKLERFGYMGVGPTKLSGFNFSTIFLIQNLYFSKFIQLIYYITAVSVRIVGP